MSADAAAPMDPAIQSTLSDRRQAKGNRMTVSTWRRVGAAFLPVVALGLLAAVLVGADLPDTLVVGNVPNSAGTPRPLPSPSSSQLLAVLLLNVAPLALRHVAPLLVLLVVIGATAVSPSADAALVVQLLAAALASYTVGELAADRLRSALAVLGTAAVAAAVSLTFGAEPVDALVVPFVVMVPAWLLGDVVRGKRIDTQRLTDQARRVRDDREAELQATRSQERQRVARELHDVLSHTVSVMVVQAVAARRVVQRSTQRAETAVVHAGTADAAVADAALADAAVADAALAEVQATGQEAMAELRQFLGALGNEQGTEVGAGQGPAGVSPQPTVDEVPALVERMRQAGLPVHLAVQGEQRPLPTSVQLAAYRIVQESLTNALRHAGGARTVVLLRYERARLRIDVSDDGPATSATEQPGGHGLVGMAERARLLGGRLAAGPRADGGFTVSAELPTQVLAP